MPRARKYRASDELITTAKRARFGGNPRPSALGTPETPAITPLQIRCTERLLALTRFCYEEYNIDPQYTRLLMSTLLTTRHLPTWLICESSRTPFWTHLNFACQQLGLPAVWDLSNMRTFGQGSSRKLAEEWQQVRTQQPRIFLDGARHQDRTWRIKVGPLHGYWIISKECVRVTMPVPMLRVPSARVEEELLRLVRGVISGGVDSTTRPWPEPVEMSRPLAEIIEALPKLNPELSEGEVPFTAFSLMPSSHAALYGRGLNELQDADWLSMMLAVKGSIRQWLRDILYWFYMADAKLKTWVDMRTMGENLGMPYTKWGPNDSVRWRLQETDRMGVTESRIWKGKRVYALTDLGMLGASLVGAGPGVRWW